MISLETNWNTFCCAAPLSRSQGAATNSDYASYWKAEGCPLSPEGRLCQPHRRAHHAVYPTSGHELYSSSGARARYWRARTAAARCILQQLHILFVVAFVLFAWEMVKLFTIYPLDFCFVMSFRGRMTQWGCETIKPLKFSTNWNRSRNKLKWTRLISLNTTNGMSARFESRVSWWSDYVSKFYAREIICWYVLHNTL